MSHTLGDRIKQAEVDTDPKRITGMNAYAIRLDGHHFSKYTRGMKKPFDARLNRLMVSVTCALLEQYNDVVTGYTASDEITLIFRENTPKQIKASHGGRIQKLASLTAAYATAYFVKLLQEEDFTDIYHFEHRVAYFDSRVIRCHSAQMASDCLWWRHRFDTFRNGVNALGQSVYSARSMHGLCTRDLLARLRKDGIMINDYPHQELFYGTLCKRVQYQVGTAFRSRVTSKVCDLRAYDKDHRVIFLTVQKYFPTDV